MYYRHIHTLNYICSLCKENDECAFNNILRYEIVSNAFLKVPYSAKFGLTMFFKNNMCLCPVTDLRD